MHGKLDKSNDIIFREKPILELESGNRKLEPYLKAAFTEMKGTMTP